MQLDDELAEPKDRLAESGGINRSALLRLGAAAVFEATICVRRARLLSGADSRAIVVDGQSAGSPQSLNHVTPWLLWRRWSSNGARSVSCTVASICTVHASNGAVLRPSVG